MDIVKESAYMLSNFEVFQLLNDIQDGKNGQKKPNKFAGNLATITYETEQYLVKTPCKDQTTEQIVAFKEAIAPFKLTKAEILQLINFRPTSAVEIQLYIEESEERLTEEDVDKVIEIIKTCFPTQETSPEDDSAMDTHEQDEVDDV